jgi:hypothetical protein
MHLNASTIFENVSSKILLNTSKQGTDFVTILRDNVPDSNNGHYYFYIS